MSKQSERVFSATFKAAVAQMEAGRKVAPLARELGVARQLLYRWHAAWRAEGLAGFGKRPGRKPGQTGGVPQALTTEAVEETVGDDPPDKAALLSDNAIAQAAARIAELERIIGQQRVDLEKSLASCPKP
ncbi:transposase [Labrys wisconsinensis]|uniref:Transposase-like protein n=1 Tax=Labrys wisconsinensis TaxID=425677 RepID=A0ABU0JEL3_9HYPH|nr:helix-turn-helix domain-containing protein [Labrys wisconsinensis]MDQ0472722.1 transposase-like protein [Labrys wisconsinensis]